MFQVACDRMRDIPVPDREVPRPGQAGLATGSSPRAHSSHGRSATSPEVSLISLVCNKLYHYSFIIKIPIHISTYTKRVFFPPITDKQDLPSLR